MMPLRFVLFAVFLELWFIPGSHASARSITGFRSPQLVEFDVRYAPSNCPTHPIPVPLPSPLPTSLTSAFTQLNSYFQQFLTNSSANGATCSVAALSYRGELVWDSILGVKNKSQPNVPPTLNTIFPVGSVSKIFTALLLYRAVDEGRVSLDDPVSKYAPKFSINDPFNTSKPITFRQIAAQMAGLPREAPCGFPCNLNTTQVFAQLAAESLILPPYTWPSYSNLGFAIIGHVIAEKVYGTTFEDLLQKAVLTPLNMTNSGYTYTPQVVSEMAVGYLLDGSPAELPIFNWTGPAGQIYSTATDLLKMLSSLTLSPGVPQILSYPVLAESLLPIFINPDLQSGYGSGWQMFLQNGYTVRWKGGNVDGYSSVVSVVPELKLGFAALWNGAVNEEAVAWDIHEILLPALVSTLSTLQPAPPLPPPSFVSAVVGSWTAVGTPTFDAQIFQTGNDLLLRVGTMTFYLRAFPVPNTLQIYFPPSLQPCILSQLVALNFEILYFNSNLSSFQVPGWVPGLVWTKQ